MSHVNVLMFTELIFLVDVLRSFAPASGRCNGTDNDLMAPAIDLNKTTDSAST
jgi:hypothetical protein